MNRHLQANNPVIVAAFHSLLTRQMLIVGVVLFVLLLGMSVLRMVQVQRLLASGVEVPNAAVADPEPFARRLLRIGFALLWILDGVLQIQPSMPLGLPASVLQPAAVSSPSWVQHLVNFGVTTWTNHPVEAAVSAVWIQIAIGVLLLVAPRGRWSRFAGLASLGWGLVVWVFGEAFGGIFAPGLSWLFGAPGAAVFYCVAGALIALPERAWASKRIGTWVLGGFGVFFAGMAVLQAWPGRGFWQGRAGHTGTGTLLSMVQQMAQTSQPRTLSSWLGSFGSFDAAHGFAVNIVVVVALGGIGVALITAQPRLVRPALAVAVVLCLADWLLVEDLGFLGGVGTDPNSMVPMLAVLVTGYAALVRVPARAEAPARAESAVAVAGTATGWSGRVRPAYAARVAASVGTLGILVLGAAPMAVASTNPNADPVIALAVDGNPNVVDFPAPSFQLVNQLGQHVSLSSFRGRTVALTFLDPVCTSDCPLIAQEFKEANKLLGSASDGAVFVAVVANPIYRSIAFTKAFDQQERLDNMRNWWFLTGTTSALTRVWNDYSVQVGVPGAGSMVAHSDIAYLIDTTGNTREVLNTDTGAGSASESSFAVLLSEQLKRFMPS
ncbi:MAG: SCO family protein [Acidimicrobiales bacterium]|jgi:cytochrome oxidase Cu insertion factor (SCO1/SenC/PrrC family)